MNIEKSRMEYIMNLVMEEVEIAIREGNFPFAAFLLDMNGNILYKAHNTSNSESDPTAHAEINLIRRACKDLNTKDLSEYILISNAWSCSMCMSAAIKAKIYNYIFGAKNESNMTPNITIYDIADKTKKTLNIITGVLENDCKKQIEKARKMKDWNDYQNSTYNDKVNNLLVEFCDNYKVNNAIDLGCGCGNEAVYLLKKGINVTCIDQQINKSFVLDRLTDDEINYASFIENSFEEVMLPKTELLMAFFSIPFCSPDKFNLLWNKIYECIESNGYFVGQLFGNRDDWNHRKDINTFTIEEAKRYLEKYEILKFEEIEYVRESDNKKWHFYNIIAQKKVKEDIE